MPITQVPAPVLAKKCTPLTATALRAGEYTDLIKRMKKDMVTNSGIGLAANQVSKDLALFVIDAKLAQENNVPDTYANPEITEYGKEKDSAEEGCLSIVGFWTPVHRSKKIMFRALDAHGKKIKFKARGLLARVLQHETDHLNGKTIRDRLTRPQ